MLFDKQKLILIKNIRCEKHSNLMFLARKCVYSLHFS